MTTLTRLAAVAVVVAVAAAARADDKVENPEYKAWANFKPGTTVTMKLINEAGGMKTESTLSRKLVEVKEDQLVWDMDMEISLNGKPLPKQSVPKSEVRKEMKASEFAPYQDVKTGRPVGATDDGTEKLKVGGTEYECKRYKYKFKTMIPNIGEEEVEGQMWECDDVPGRMVKITGKSKSTVILMDVVEITIKK